MNLTEIVVLIGGLILGFGVVYGLMGGSKQGTAPGNGQRRYKPPRQYGDGMASTWFRILEVSEYAPRAEIEGAYRSKISQYHPDKVAQMGPEIRELAESKSQEINAAYSYAMQLLDAQGR